MLFSNKEDIDKPNNNSVKTSEPKKCQILTSPTVASIIFLYTIIIPEIKINKKPVVVKPLISVELLESLSVGIVRSIPWNMISLYFACNFFGIASMIYPLLLFYMFCM